MNAIKSEIVYATKGNAVCAIRITDRISETELSSGHNIGSKISRTKILRQAVQIGKDRFTILNSISTYLEDVYIVKVHMCGDELSIVKL